MDTQKNNTTVPYISASKMDKIMELVSERSLNNVSHAYFESYNFGKADAYLAMNVLRFLGLIDDGDKATDLAKKFQLKGDARDKEVQVVIKSAYAKIFEITEKPYELSKDDLANEFIHNYNLTRRIAQSAVPAFLKLCEFSGLVEKGLVLTRKREVKSGTKPEIIKNKSNKATLEGESYTSIPFADGEIKFIVPTNILTKAILDNRLGTDLRTVTDAILKFTNDYVKKDDEPVTHG